MFGRSLERRLTVLEQRADAAGPGLSRSMVAAMAREQGFTRAETEEATAIALAWAQKRDAWRRQGVSERASERAIFERMATELGESLEAVIA